MKSTATAPALALEAIAAELRQLGLACEATTGERIAASGPAPAHIIRKAAELAQDNGLHFTGIGAYIGRSDAFDLHLYFAKF